MAALHVSPFIKIVFKIWTNTKLRHNLHLYKETTYIIGFAACHTLEHALEERTCICTLHLHIS